jgi:hypothetical protein
MASGKEPSHPAISTQESSLSKSGRLRVEGEPLLLRWKSVGWQEALKHQAVLAVSLSHHLQTGSQCRFVF